MINTHDYRMEMYEEARRSKERVRQLLAIQIEAQLNQDKNCSDTASQATWSDVSRSGEFEAIGT